MKSKHFVNKILNILILISISHQQRYLITFRLLFLDYCTLFRLLSDFEASRRPGWLWYKMAPQNRFIRASKTNSAMKLHFEIIMSWIGLRGFYGLYRCWFYHSSCVNFQKYDDLCRLQPTFPIIIYFELLILILVSWMFFCIISSQKGIPQYWQILFT